MVTGRKPKPVEQISLQTGEVVQTFDSLSKAASHLGLTHTAISKCINGTLCKVGGYYWRWKGSDDTPATGRAKMAAMNEKKTAVKANPYNRKTCLQVDLLTGRIIKSYPSIRDAALACKMKSSAIGNACHGRSSSAGGFCWKLEEKLKESERLSCKVSVSSPSTEDDAIVESRTSSNEEQPTVAPGVRVGAGMSMFFPPQNSKCDTIRVCMAPNTAPAYGNLHDDHISSLASTRMAMDAPSYCTEQTPYDRLQLHRTLEAHRIARSIRQRAAFQFHDALRSRTFLSRADNLGPVHGRTTLGHVEHRRLQFSSQTSARPDVRPTFSLRCRPLPNGLESNSETAAYSALSFVRSISDKGLLTTHANPDYNGSDPDCVKSSKR